MTMTIRPFFLLILASLAVACPKENKDSGQGTSSSSTAKTKKESSKGDDDDDGAKEKKNAKKKGDDDDGTTAGKGDDDGANAAGGPKIGGVSVPAWAQPKHSKGNCAPDKSDDDKLKALKTGDDGGLGFDDGKGDVLALVAGMKDTCPSAGATVSQAVTAGGYSRYAKKQYAQADGWFARALVADPANTFARYDLACNLALEGKSDDALWNLSQLVPAAKAGDPRALHYLRKAKADSDLASVRGDAKFAAATKAGDAASGAHKCDGGKDWNGHDACIQICNAYGTTANCDAGDSCVGTGAFGDDLVPYCADALVCKGKEQKGVVAIPTEGGADFWQRACVLPCDSSDDCPQGKKCSAAIGVPTAFNSFLFLTGCE